MANMAPNSRLRAAVRGTPTPASTWACLLVLQGLMLLAYMYIYNHPWQQQQQQAASGTNSSPQHYADYGLAEQAARDSTSRAAGPGHGGSVGGAIEELPVVKPSNAWRPVSVSAESAAAEHARCENYLVGGAYWGLNNQIGSLLRAMATGRLLGNATCTVVPMWSLDYDDPSLQWDLQPFEFFYDWEATAAAAAKHGVLLVRALPAQLVPRCIAQLQNHNVGTDNITLPFLRHLVRKFGVACLSAPNTNIGLAKVALEHVSLPLLPLLQPSSRFQRLVDRALHTMSVKFNSTSFVSVQGRVEEDWVQACQKGFQEEKRMFGKSCFIGDAALARYLAVDRRLANRSLIYMASGHNKAAFRSTCSAFTCVFKDDLVDTKRNADIFAHTTSAAFLDQLISGRAHEFHGNIFSSFARASVFLQAANNRVGLYYNPPCNPPFGVGHRWWC